MQTQQIVAKDNVKYFADQYRSESLRLTGYSYVPRTDPAISASCPQGKGFASVYFTKKFTPDEIKARKESGGGTVNTDVDVDGISKIEVMCSTSNEALGCILKSDFDKKPEYARYRVACASPNDVPVTIKPVQVK